MVTEISRSGGDIPGSSAASFGQAPTPPRTPAFPSTPGTQVRNLQGQFGGGYYVAWSGLQQVVEMPQTLESDLQTAIEEVLTGLRDDMVNYAKENAPWRDVTGDAREGLHSPGVVRNSDDSWSILIAHTVSYGLYLETRDGGAWGILRETVLHFADEIGGRVHDSLAVRRR